MQVSEEQIEALRKRVETVAPSHRYLGGHDVREMINDLLSTIQAAASVPPHSGVAVKPYAHEYGRSNGDGTYSVTIHRGAPVNPVSDWPVTPLFLLPSKSYEDGVREAAQIVNDFIGWGPNWRREIHAAILALLPSTGAGK